MLDYTKDKYFKKSFKTVLIISLAFGFLVSAFYYVRDYLDTHVFLVAGFLISFLFTASITFVLFTINMRIARFLENKFPWKKYQIKRLIIEFLVTNLIAITVMSIFLIAMLTKFSVEDFGQSLVPLFFDHFAQAVLFNTIATFTVEFGVVTKQWKESIIRTERLEKENILSQFETLKHQLNPHFMFNSLNALSSLIDDDPANAKKFLNMFSKMYRYILDVKDKLVVRVDEELEFLNSYIFTQQIRYNKNLIVDIKIDARNLKKFLPPLSLQLLVENAIKHNEISNENPLNISISDEPDKIIIKNTLKYREDPNNKSGIGLDNLRKRIKFISEKEPEFYAQNGEYIAKIPFIDIDE